MPRNKKLCDDRAEEIFWDDKDDEKDFLKRIEILDKIIKEKISNANPKSLQSLGEVLDSAYKEYFARTDNVCKFCPFIIIGLLVDFVLIALLFDSMRL